MRRFQIFTIAVIVSASAFAQQPFEKYGYNAKVLTLSQGKYEEFFDQDTLVQIGSVIMNRLTGKILSFVEYDTIYSEATLEPEIISRWLSPDPLAEEFFEWSPYNFSYNNPIRYNDPDGRAAWDVVITGAESQSAFNELQASVQNELNLSMDASGKVSYTQTSNGQLSKDAQQLVDAVDNSSIVVNITAENTTTTAGGDLYIGGAFSGNTVTTGQNGNTVVAEQEVNPDVLNKVSTAHGKPGADMLHEVTEAYQGGLISQKKGKSSPGSNQRGSVYPRAHSKATKQSGRIHERIYDTSGNQLQMLPGNVYPAGVKSADWYVNDKQGNKVVIQVIK